MCDVDLSTAISRTPKPQTHREWYPAPAPVSLPFSLSENIVSVYRNEQLELPPPGGLQPETAPSET